MSDNSFNYPKIPNLSESNLSEYSRLNYEYGADREDIQALLEKADQTLKQLKEELLSLPENEELKANEPDTLEAIRALRKEGPRKICYDFNQGEYRKRLQGALLGRFAGCTLGAPVEFWSIEDMKDWADYIGDEFPPNNYWSEIKAPNEKRYGVSEKFKYTSEGLYGVPVDDDITYTILGLLIMEDYGVNFSIEDVGKAWVKYLPYACTAEEVALNNLKEGVSALKAGEKDNPFVQWIGADIRSDPWGYLAPGLPEKAAEFAYKDAYISHRRNGIYGEMFFSAVIAAAFATNSVIEAFEMGLTEIPAECSLAIDIRWALSIRKEIKNYNEAITAVEARFDDMSGVHTNLNACLTIFGLMIGKDDFTKVIGETVAMGYDNDCTAATAGSIFGAVNGIEAIPEYWYKNFNNSVLTYIKGYPQLRIDDLIDRFTKQAEKIVCNN